MLTLIFETSGEDVIGVKEIIKSALESRFPDIKCVDVKATDDQMSIKE